jgi:hypothetical protein
MSCAHKLEPEQQWMQGSKRTWILLALVFGLTIAVSGLLDLLLQGIPLGFMLPLLN